MPGICYDHAQSRLAVMSASKFHDKGDRMLAEAFWLIAKHYAKEAQKSYAERLIIPARDLDKYEHYLTGPA